MSKIYKLQISSSTKDLIQVTNSSCFSRIASIFVVTHDKKLHMLVIHS